MGLRADAGGRAGLAAARRRPGSSTRRQLEFCPPVEARRQVFSRRLVLLSSFRSLPALPWLSPRSGARSVPLKPTKAAPPPHRSGDRVDRSAIGRLRCAPAQAATVPPPRSGPRRPSAAWGPVPLEAVPGLSAPCALASTRGRQQELGEEHRDLGELRRGLGVRDFVPERRPLRQRRRLLGEFSRERDRRRVDRRLALRERGGDGVRQQCPVERELPREGPDVVEILPAAVQRVINVNYRLRQPPWPVRTMRLPCLPAPP
jgi:hypothetical protein